MYPDPSAQRHQPPVPAETFPDHIDIDPAAAPGPESEDLSLESIAEGVFTVSQWIRGFELVSAEPKFDNYKMFTAARELASSATSIFPALDARRAEADELYGDFLLHRNRSSEALSHFQRASELREMNELHAGSIDPARLQLLDKMLVSCDGSRGRRHLHPTLMVLANYLDGVCKLALPGADSRHERSFFERSARVALEWVQPSVAINRVDIARRFLRHGEQLMSPGSGEGPSNLSAGYWKARALLAAKDGRHFEAEEHTQRRLEALTLPNASAAPYPWLAPAHHSSGELLELALTRNALASLQLYNRRMANAVENFSAAIEIVRPDRREWNELPGKFHESFLTCYENSLAGLMAAVNSYIDVGDATEAGMLMNSVSEHVFEYGSRCVPLLLRSKVATMKLGVISRSGMLISDAEEIVQIAREQRAGFPYESAHAAYQAGILLKDNGADTEMQEQCFSVTYGIACLDKTSQLFGLEVQSFKELVERSSPSGRRAYGKTALALHKKLLKAAAGDINLANPEIGTSLGLAFLMIGDVKHGTAYTVLARKLTSDSRPTQHQLRLAQGYFAALLSLDLSESDRQGALKQVHDILQTQVQRLRPDRSRPAELRYEQTLLIVLSDLPDFHSHRDQLRIMRRLKELGRRLAGGDA